MTLRRAASLALAALWAGVGVAAALADANSPRSAGRASRIGPWIEPPVREPTVALRGPWNPTDLVKIGPTANDLAGLHKHEGNWEMIQLDFDAANAETALRADGPAEVGYSSHEGAERADWGDDKLEVVDGTHPVRLLAPVVALEGLSGLAALRRSGQLVRGRWLRVGSLVALGAGVPLAAGPLVGAALIFATSSSLAFLNLVAGVVYAVVLPFAALVVSYTYLDARVRNELEPADAPEELPAEVVV